MAPKINLQGKAFGDLTVVNYAGYVGKRTFWNCVCSCGNSYKARTEDLLKRGVNSCGCKTGQNISNRIIKDPLKSAKNQVFNNYRNGANNRNISFEISKEWFLIEIFKECVYCGSSPSNIYTELNKRKLQLIYNGLDRVDNAIGYTQANCVPCCKTCNYAKHDGSHKDFLAWINRLIKFQMENKYEN